MQIIKKGENPELLILTGTHGDEYEVINLVKEYLEKNKSKIPDYLYLPEVSPSAVELKTRENSLKHDLNRNFIKDTTDPEARAVIDYLDDKKFDVCLDFHEDPELSEFYFYDSGILDTSDLKDWISLLEKSKIKTYTGIDDKDDPLLGYKFEKGYKSFLDYPVNPSAGFLWDWSQTEKAIRRMVTLEVPGKLDLDKKYKIVELVFENLLPKLYNS